METIKYLFKAIFAIVDRIADEMEEVRVNMLALEYDRFEGYPNEKTMQKQMQTYRALEAKAVDLDQEKLNEKRISIRPKKEEIAKTRISDMYGYCQDNFFRASKNAVAKRLGEAPTDVEKQEPNKQTVPTASWLIGRKKNDDREVIRVNGKGGKPEDSPPKMIYYEKLQKTNLILSDLYIIIQNELLS